MLVECPKCKGTGKQKSIIIFTNCKDGTGWKELEHPIKCTLCNGERKIDWIKRIVLK